MTPVDPCGGELAGLCLAARTAVSGRQSSEFVLGMCTTVALLHDHTGSLDDLILHGARVITAHMELVHGLPLNMAVRRSPHPDSPRHARD